MPFIDLRTTVPAAPEQREALKAAFGQAITAIAEIAYFIRAYKQQMSIYDPA